MSLFCGKCSQLLAGPYEIFCFLGHTRTGLIAPEKVPPQLKRLLCFRHPIKTGDIEESFMEMKRGKGTPQFVFALIHGIVPPHEKPYAYGEAQEDELKKQGRFDKATFFSGDVALHYAEHLTKYFLVAGSLV